MCCCGGGGGEGCQVVCFTQVASWQRSSIELSSPPYAEVTRTLESMRTNGVIAEENNQRKTAQRSTNGMMGTPWINLHPFLTPPDPLHLKLNVTSQFMQDVLEYVARCIAEDQHPMFG